MQVYIAYGLVVLIWSTTPLGIQWSTEDGVSFIAAVSLRMVLALVVALGVLSVRRRRLFQTAEDWKTFAVASLGIFPCMPLVYWSAQFIPSGLIAVIMGMSPFFTGVASIFLLRDNPFNGRSIGAMVTAVLGLGVIYIDQQEVGADGVYGVLGITVSCLIFSVSSVWLKRVAANIDALRQTTGALLMSLPGLLSVWWWLDDGFVNSISNKALISIGYLAIFGSLLGFSLYFYLLRHLSPNVVSLTSLVTPILALLLGVVFADEQLSLKLLTGAGMVVMSLAIYHRFNPFKGALRRLWQRERKRY